MSAKKARAPSRIAADNRRARFNYEIGQTFEAGLALTGTEVKSLREGRSNITDSYAGEHRGELWLYNAYIPEYLQANRFQHETLDAALRAVLDRFPGAEIVAIRSPADAPEIAAPSGPDSADDIIYADEDDDGDED